MLCNLVIAIVKLQNIDGLLQQASFGQFILNAKFGIMILIVNKLFLFKHHQEKSLNIMKI